MFKTLVNAFREKTIRKKLLFTLLVLLCFRIGCFIPVPGISPDAFGALTSGAGSDFFSVLSTITGGSLQNGTLFALGILPFINASIIMQLLTLIIPSLDRMMKDPDGNGRAKMTQITRYVAIGLAFVQAIGICISWSPWATGSDGTGYITSIFEPGTTGTAFSMVFVVLALVAGSALVMWMSDLITEKGVGNGASLIIFVGILSGFISGFTSEIKLVTGDVTRIWRILLYLLVVVIVFVAIIFIDMSERRISLKGGAPNQYLPIRINSGGVMPIIFASSFLMFPQLIASFWPSSSFYAWWTKYMGVGTWAYSVLLALLIFFFAFFYSKIQFDPEQVLKTIQRRGLSIQGYSNAKEGRLRYSKPYEYLNTVNNRITLMGAIFLAFIALIPGLVFRAILGSNSGGLVNAFSATGMLIVVSVALEFNSQLEQQLMMKNYKNFKSLLR